MPADDARGSGRNNHPVAAENDIRPVRTGAGADLPDTLDALDAAEIVVKAAAQAVLRAVAELGAGPIRSVGLDGLPRQGRTVLHRRATERRSRRLALLDKNLYAVTEPTASLRVGQGETRTVQP
jgi:hypothetical protein